MNDLKELKEQYPNFVFGKFDYPIFFTEQALNNPNIPKNGYSTFEYVGEYDEIVPKPYFIPCLENEANAIAIYGDHVTYANIPLFIVFFHTGQMYDPPKLELNEELIMPVIFNMERNLENNRAKYNESTKYFLEMLKTKMNLDVQDIPKLWYATFDTPDVDWLYMIITVYSGASNITELFANEDFVEKLGEYNEWKKP
jgi:hypothetical protein